MDKHHEPHIYLSFCTYQLGIAVMVKETSTKMEHSHIQCRVVATPDAHKNQPSVPCMHITRRLIPYKKISLCLLTRSLVRRYTRGSIVLRH